MGIPYATLEDLNDLTAILVKKEHDTTDMIKILKWTVERTTKLEDKVNQITEMLAILTNLPYMIYFDTPYDEWNPDKAREYNDMHEKLRVKLEKVLEGTPK